MNYSIAIVTTMSLLILGGEDVQTPLLFPGSNNTLDMALLIDGQPIDAETLGSAGVTSAVLQISDSEGNVVHTYSGSSSIFVFTTRKTVNGIPIAIIQFLHSAIGVTDLPAPGYYQAQLTTKDSVNIAGLVWQPFPVRVP